MQVSFKIVLHKLKMVKCKKCLLDGHNIRTCGKEKKAASKAAKPAKLKPKSVCKPSQLEKDESSSGKDLKDETEDDVPALFMAKCGTLVSKLEFDALKSVFAEFTFMEEHSGSDFAEQDMEMCEKLQILPNNAAKLREIYVEQAGELEKFFK